MTLRAKHSKTSSVPDGIDPAQVSDDKPFDAMARLGLALVQEPI